MSRATGVAVARRIETLEDLATLTRTMRTLSGVAIRQFDGALRALEAHERVLSLADRALALNRTSGARRASVGVAPKAVASDRAHRAAASGVRARIVAIGSEHGLCGRFNERIAERVVELAAPSPPPRPSPGPDAGSASVSIPGSSDAAAISPAPLVLGARIAGALQAHGLVPALVLPAPAAPGAIDATARETLATLERWQRDEDAGRAVWLVYHRRAAEGSAIDVLDLFAAPAPTRVRRGDWPSPRWPVIDTDPATLARWLRRQAMFVSLYRAIAESAAVEHAHRLAAMNAATRNIDERLSESRDAARRLRQASITAELLDTVSGFDAVTRRGR